MGNAYSFLDSFDWNRVRKGWSMNEKSHDEPAVEADDRFRSGEWRGFFLEPEVFSERVWMDLVLSFRDGSIHGSGRDCIGEFVIRGRYETDDGQCWWTKKYVGKHDVFYAGVNGKKGIPGMWEISPCDRGGFHIWPKSMPDPTAEDTASEQEELFAFVDELSWEQDFAVADAPSEAAPVLCKQRETHFKACACARFLLGVLFSGTCCV